jgi:hypothetical protein
VKTNKYYSLLICTCLAATRRSSRKLETRRYFLFSTLIIAVFPASVPLQITRFNPFKCAFQILTRQALQDVLSRQRRTVFLERTRDIAVGSEMTRSIISIKQNLERKLDIYIYIYIIYKRLSHTAPNQLYLNLATPSCSGFLAPHEPS